MCLQYKFSMLYFYLISLIKNMSYLNKLQGNGVLIYELKLIYLNQDYDFDWADYVKELIFLQLFLWEWVWARKVLCRMNQSYKINHKPLNRWPINSLKIIVKYILHLV